ncbi:hypothetical protein M427DRAFT_474074 [Gonapodya prolifera JEL478]|uniref:Uncharacterized protein n=1 Tax=Gonapodya prolifera (strain JEL478) TaxID=1344416 RepID=A0A139ARE7_GONPJ|nr:hypothetical protein M427DRAFT_474074 [Gonapodya prolifera JEL478]|eukprot:KXS19318.1 hypothetical protein M427DRAFT_474074 [Gonapodya prolifera JEL478]
MLAVGQQTGRVSLVRLSSFSGLASSANHTGTSISVTSPSQRPLVELQPRHARTCNAVSFCPSDPRFLAAGFDKVRNDSGLYVWDVEHGGESTWGTSNIASWSATAARRFDSLSEDEVSSVGVQPELAAPTASRPLSIVGVPTHPSSLHPPRSATPTTTPTSPPPPRGPQATFAPAESLNSLAWLPTLPHRLATGAGGKHLRLYDLRQGSGAAPSAAVATRHVAGVCFDPRRPYVMASYAEGLEGGIRVWDLRRLGEPVVGVACPTEWKQGVAQIGWCGDRAGILAGSGMNSPVVKIWDVVESVELKKYAFGASGATGDDSTGAEDGETLEMGSEQSATLASIVSGGVLGSSTGGLKDNPSSAGSRAPSTNPVVWRVRSTKTGYGTPVTCFAFVPGPVPVRVAVSGIVAYSSAPITAPVLPPAPPPPLPPAFSPLPPQSVDEAAHRLILITTNTGVQQHQPQHTSGNSVVGNTNTSGSTTVATLNVHSASRPSLLKSASQNRLSNLTSTSITSTNLGATRSVTSTRSSPSPRRPSPIRTQTFVLGQPTLPSIYSIASGDPSERIEVIELRESLKIVWDPLGGLAWSGGRSIAVVGAGEMLRVGGGWTAGASSERTTGTPGEGRRSAPGTISVSARRNTAALAITLPHGVLLHRDIYDVAFVIRARALRGYGMDPEKNVELFVRERAETKAQWREREADRIAPLGRKSNSPWSRTWSDDVTAKELRNVWEWVATAKQLVASGKAVIEGRELGFNGVAAVMEDALLTESGSRQTSNNLEPYRRVALAMCGWGSPDPSEPDRDRDELERVLQGMEERKEWEKAAGWSLFRGGGLARAVKSLNNSGSERLRLVGTALAAAAAGSKLPNELVNGVLVPGGPVSSGALSTRGNKSGGWYDGMASPSNLSRPSPASSSPSGAPLQALWREMFGGLAKDLTDAYLRAMFSLIAKDGDWNGVLNEQGISLRDRIGVALRFLNNKELGQFIRRTTYKMMSWGNLEGLLLTGLQPAGIELLEKYVDKTGDVQTAALLGSVVVPGRFADPRVDEWVENYRCLLDRFQFYHQRAHFDISRGRFISGEAYLPSSAPLSILPRTASSTSFFSGGKPSSSGNSSLTPGSAPVQMPPTPQQLLPQLPPLSALARRYLDVPPQVALKCTYCSNSLQHTTAIFGMGNGLPGGAGIGSGIQIAFGKENGKLLAGQPGTVGATANMKDVRHTVCPHCKKPLPRCAVCELPMGTPHDTVRYAATSHVGATPTVIGSSLAGHGSHSSHGSIVSGSILQPGSGPTYVGLGAGLDIPRSVSPSGSPTTGEEGSIGTYSMTLSPRMSRKGSYQVDSVIGTPTTGSYIPKRMATMGERLDSVHVPSEADGMDGESVFSGRERDDTGSDVRGAAGAIDMWFTWCQKCGHGGHAGHIVAWFKRHAECPVADCDCWCSGV